MRLIDADILVEIGMFDEEEVEEMLKYAGVEDDEEVENNEDKRNT